MIDTNTDDLFRLDGKVALVTAAAGGLGSAIAKGLAYQGADVVVTDVEERALAEVHKSIVDCGRRSLSMPLDVSQSEQVQKVVSQAAFDMGRIDILVNVACSAVLKPMLEMSEDEFDRTMGTCLRGAFLISQSVGKVMVDRGQGGSIIHISSIASFRALGRGTGAYAASKAGLNAMVRELAVELAPQTIRVNAIAPCQFRTPTFEEVLDNPQHGGREALLAKVTSRIPLGRIGEPREIVGAAVFLATNASSMITGHVLPLDGGFMAS